MKADHVLMILGLLIIAMVATQTVWHRSSAQAMVGHNCALFYGSLGTGAERQCRIKMLQQHSLSSDAQMFGDGSP